MRNQRISARRKEISLSSISCRRSSRGHERYSVALKQPRVRRISIGNVSCWDGPAVLSGPKPTVEQDGEASKLKELTMHIHQRSANPIATIGLDIGKNTFHLVGLDKRGA